MKKYLEQKEKLKELNKKSLYELDKYEKSILSYEKEKLEKKIKTYEDFAKEEHDLINRLFYTILIELEDSSWNSEVEEPLIKLIKNNLKRPTVRFKNTQDNPMIDQEKLIKEMFKFLNELIGEDWEDYLVIKADEDDNKYINLKEE